MTATTLHDNRIQIYDNEFTWSQRFSLYEYVQKSNFRISGEDTPDQESVSPNLPFFISEWNTNDLARSELLQSINNNELLSKFRVDKIRRCFVNFDFGREIHHVHTHYGDNVLLYQANMEWRPEWYGETFYYDDDCENIVYINEYTPGRLIFFDGEVPHAFRPPSRVAPYFRFTISMFIEKGE